MLDYLGIFRKLNEKGIRYVVAGGLAVNLYGIPRMTYDIDLMLDLEDDNLRKFLRLLKSWGFRPRAPVGIMDFAIKGKREDWIKNKNMRAFTLINPAWAISEIDILIAAPFDFSRALKRAGRIELNDISVPVLSINDLIRMKIGTGRSHDEADVNLLRRLKREKKQ